MRVLMFSGSMPPMRCGVGDYTAALAAALNNAGVALAVVTSSAADGRRAGRRGVLPVLRGWSARHLLACARLITRLSPDIVHVQYPTQGYGRARAPYVLPLLARLLGRRVVITWHEPLPPSPAGLTATALGAAAHAIIVVRANFRDLMRGARIRVAERRPIRFIPNATSIPVARLDAAGVEAVRAEHRVPPGRRLVAFFGFILPSKGVELLFEIADPGRDHLVIAGDDVPGGTHRECVRVRAEADGWSSRTTFAGFLASESVARLLAAADAVVLPYRDGAGHWNTSVHAVQAQGTFLVTTSRAATGFEPEANTWWCAPDDVAAMRTALAARVGQRGSPRPDSGWSRIADEHVAVYRSVLAPS